jgi:hypothetical protein
MQHFWRVTSAPGTPQTHDRLGVRGAPRDIQPIQYALLYAASPS